MDSTVRSGRRLRDVPGADQFRSLPDILSLELTPQSDPINKSRTLLVQPVCFAEQHAQINNPEAKISFDSLKGKIRLSSFALWPTTGSRRVTTVALVEPFFWELHRLGKNGEAHIYG